MEIFTQGIPWHISRYDLIRTLAETLHGPNFRDISAGALINFDVFLLKDKTHSHSHGGQGFLTLPTAVIGERFLLLFGPRTYSRPRDLPLSVKFTRSKKFPGGRDEVIQRILSMPYVDPQAQEERQQRTEQLSGNRVYIRSVQFGWECRDGVFSIEWERNFTQLQECVLAFQEERGARSLSVEWGGGPVSPEPQYIISINHTQLHCAYAGQTNAEDAIVFSLKSPPTLYEKSPTPNSSPVNDILTEFLLQYQASASVPLRRLSHLPDEDHARVAPFASLALRVVCRSSTDLQQFRKHAATAQLQHVYSDPYPTVRRQLFSAEVFDLLGNWLRRLHWIVSFQILSIVHEPLIDVREALAIMPRILALSAEESPEFVAKALQKLHDRVNMKDDSSQEFDILRILNQVVDDLKEQSGLELTNANDPNICWIHHVTITPTAMKLDGPAPEQSNRIIRQFDRKYHPCFLRVSFFDEANYKYRFDRDVDGAGFIKARVGNFLLNGLVIARRRYEFLAYSQSALKEHCVWFVRPFVDESTGRRVDRTTIINAIGTFEYQLRRCPARYAARISQAFTATDASIRAEAEEVIVGQDIETEDGKYCFTDGVGTISRELADEIVAEIRESKRRRTLKNVPRAFQIRLMGSKGMLSVDHRLTGRVVVLRPSMVKFEGSESRVLEIARAFDKPGMYYLNRPLIMILEGLGVPFETFKKYQDIAIQETQKATRSLKGLAGLLEQHGLGTSFRLHSVLLNLEKLHISSLPGDKFYSKIVESSVNHVLRELKTRARIPIPGGWTLVGVADAHGYLQADEVFACIKDSRKGVLYLEGKVLISRSPVIHPGDVTIVKAIGAPPPGSPFAIERLPNTVVFSIKGDRPVPTCLGGGDLDGDLYNLIPLRDLPEFFPSMLCEPASYEPAPKKLLDRGSTMNDVADFVMEYIISDVLGMVATNWLTIADQTQSMAANIPPEERGIFSPECLQLAKLHSDAVDYPKSGQPVPVNTIPRPARGLPRPDWMRPETVGALGDEYYPSQTALGRLTRAVTLPTEEPVRQRRRRGPGSRLAASDVGSSDSESIDELASLADNLTLDSDGDDDDDASAFSTRQSPVQAAIKNKVREYIQFVRPSATDMQFVRRLYLAFVDEFRSICVMQSLTSGPLSEEEVITGTISQKTSVHKRRKEMTAKMREKSDILVRAMKEQLMGGEEVPAEESLWKAWVAWEFSQTKTRDLGGRSFGFVCLFCIFEAMKEIDEMDRQRAREMWY